MSWTEPSSGLTLDPFLDPFADADFGGASGSGTPVHEEPRGSDKIHIRKCAGLLGNWVYIAKASSADTRLSCRKQESNSEMVERC